MQTLQNEEREKLVRNHLSFQPRESASLKEEEKLDDRTKPIPRFPNKSSISLTMQFLFLLFGLLASVVSVSATALTTKVEAHEKSCFYTRVEEASLKVAFYFAVCVPTI